MLKLAFRAVSRLDHALATPTQRSDAMLRARHAAAVYGDRAIDVLLTKLRDSRRCQSKRTLRIAVARLIAEAA